MTDSFQNEVPTARIDIKFDLHTGNVKKKAELPPKLLTVGDYDNRKEQRPLSERDKVDINRNSPNSVMAEFSSAVNLTVEDTLNGNGNEQNIVPEFRNLKDFGLEQVTKNTPQLRVLFAMRSLLRSLKSNLLDSATFRRELENILKDPMLSSELRDELVKTAPQKNA